MRSSTRDDKRIHFAALAGVVLSRRAVVAASAGPRGAGGDSLALSACGFLSPSNGPQWPLQTGLCFSVGAICLNSNWQGEIQFDFFLLLILSLHKALWHCLRLYPYGVIKRKLISTLRGFLVLKSNLHLAGSFYSSACSLSFLDFDIFCLSGIFLNTSVLKKTTDCWCTICELSL